MSVNLRNWIFIISSAFEESTYRTNLMQFTEKILLDMKKLSHSTAEIASQFLIPYLVKPNMALIWVALPSIGKVKPGITWYQLKRQYIKHPKTIDTTTNNGTSSLSAQLKSLAIKKKTSGTSIEQYIFELENKNSCLERNIFEELIEKINNAHLSLASIALAIYLLRRAEDISSDMIDQYLTLLAKHASRLILQGQKFEVFHIVMIIKGLRTRQNCHGIKEILDMLTYCLPQVSIDSTSPHKEQLEELQACFPDFDQKGYEDPKKVGHFLDNINGIVAEISDEKLTSAVSRIVNPK